jgi:hypothetical protein
MVSISRKSAAAVALLEAANTWQIVDSLSPIFL